MYSPYCYYYHMQQQLNPFYVPIPPFSEKAPSEVKIENRPEQPSFLEESDDKPEISPVLEAKDILNSTGCGQKRPWGEGEDKLLCILVQEQNLDWKTISSRLQGRSESMCYSRYRRLLMKSKSYYWKHEDDLLIVQLVQKLGYKWKEISRYMPMRTAKQIREHYLNFLRPNINKNDWEIEEDIKLAELVKKEGNKWKSFEDELPGRTENQIKSRYYGKLKRIIENKQKEKKNCR